MCWYTLDICPYPDLERVSTLLFQPNKLKQWEYCDAPTAWGRLSCGKLIINHPTTVPEFHDPHSLGTALATRSNLLLETEGQQQSTPVTLAPPVPVASCPWCTTVIKSSATKSKEVQAKAQKALNELEETMDANTELRALQKEVQDKTHELNLLKHAAWTLLRDKSGDQSMDNCKCEKDDSEG